MMNMFENADRVRLKARCLVEVHSLELRLKAAPLSATSRALGCIKEPSSSENREVRLSRSQRDGREAQWAGGSKASGTKTNIQRGIV